MLFHTDNEPDASIQGNDNINSYNAFMENLDDGGSGEDSEGGGFGFSRFLLIAFIVLFTAILVGYGIFSWYEAEQYRKWDAWSPIPEPTRNLQRLLTSLWSPRAFS